jgi:hypothetical protein
MLTHASGVGAICQVMGTAPSTYGHYRDSLTSRPTELNRARADHADLSESRPIYRWLITPCECGIPLTEADPSAGKAKPASPVMCVRASSIDVGRHRSRLA